jgi:hypothetical protein
LKCGQVKDTASVTVKGNSEYNKTWNYFWARVPNNTFTLLLLLLVLLGSTSASTITLLPSSLRQPILLSCYALTPCLFSLCLEAAGLHTSSWLFRLQRLPHAKGEQHKVHHRDGPSSQAQDQPYTCPGLCLYRRREEHTHRPQHHGCSLYSSPSSPYEPPGWALERQCCRDAWG